MADNLIQHWLIKDAGNGQFYLLNGNSGKYLTGNSSNSTQNDLNGSKLQKWQFVLSNPTDGPKSRYALAGSVADSAGTNNGTAVGNPTYVAGPTGAANTAIKLNGTSQYVQLPGGVASKGNITLSTSVKWDGGNAFQRIFDFGKDTTSYMFLTPKNADGLMHFGITTGGYTSEQILETTALPIGQWVNLTLTLGGNTGILYVNGRPQVAGQITLNPSDVTSTLNYLGKSQFSSDPLFSGSISDFRVFDYALSQLQIMDLSARNVTWTGATNAVWDNNTTANFKLATNAATAFAYVDNVTFDGSAAAVTLAADVTPRSLAVGGAANTTFTGSGSISGPGALVKTGAGTLTLANSGQNTFTGGTTISGGTVVAAASDALGFGPIALIGGTLTSANTNGNEPALGNTIVAGGGNIAAGVGTLLRINGGITGTGALGLSGVFNGAGLRLAGNNADYSGTATVTGANVRLGAATAGSAAAKWVVNGNLQTDVVGTASFDLGALGGTGTVSGHAVNTSAAVSTLVVGALNTNTTFGGRILNNALNDAATGNADGAQNNVLALTKVGTGTLTLSGANAYTGPTAIKGGTLIVSGSIASPAAVVSAGQSDGGSGTLTVQAGGVVTGDEVWIAARRRRSA